MSERKSRNYKKRSQAMITFENVTHLQFIHPHLFEKLILLQILQHVECKLTVIIAVLAHQTAFLLPFTKHTIMVILISEAKKNRKSSLELDWKILGKV